jgi:alkylation response protein AidB-like acyl-CoA dehydrogenase
VLLVSADRAKIIATWNTTGMRGTGSHDFVLEDVFIPEEDSLSLAEIAKRKGPLYLYPPLFLVTHAAVPLGIARAALDEARKICKTKTLPPHNQLLAEDPIAWDCIGRAEAALAAARAYTYGTLADLWASLSTTGFLSDEQRVHYRSMIIHAHQAGKQIVDSLVDLLATSAVIKNSILDRALRDVTTACSHRQVNSRLYRSAGRVHLGLGAGDPSF